MRKHMTIRGGLVATIALYTILLIAVIAVGILGLYGSNSALREMYRDDTASLLHLKTSSERLLLLRGGFGEVEQLISAGKPAQREIARQHALLNESNKELEAFRKLHEPVPAEKVLIDAMQARRDQLLAQVFQKALTELDQDNLVDFLTTQREAPVALFSDYQSALTALENFQVERQKARFETTDARFSAMLWALGAAAIVALVIGFFAQRILTRAIVRPIGKAVDYFGRISAGDLTSTVTVQSDNEMGYMLNALKGMQDGLAQTVQKVRSSAETIVRDAHAISGGNLDLSARTEQQAASLQEAASSMEQLTATVRQNADNARNASELAAGASDIALRGGEVVNRVVATMDAISGSSDRIVGIVGVIEGIAFQTNILALNAAVEAARAGEQGRGFAVVASEVRSLAQRSASAAKEIKELIGDSTLSVKDGSQLVAHAGSTMVEVVEAVRRVSAIMAEISLASGEQSAGIEQVNLTVAQMEEMTQQNSALVEEASAAAVSLEEQSRQLNDAVALFRLKDDVGNLV
jgi:methyl-accepting chemotaxis protein I, serine sensor receptor